MLEPGQNMLGIVWYRIYAWEETVDEDLDPDKHTIVMCHHGIRSMRVCQRLAALGFTDLSNVQGGIHAYTMEIDNSLPTYWDCYSDCSSHARRYHSWKLLWLMVSTVCDDHNFVFSCIRICVQNNTWSMMPFAQVLISIWAATLLYSMVPYSHPACVQYFASTHYALCVVTRNCSRIYMWRCVGGILSRWCWNNTILIVS